MRAIMELGKLAAERGSSVDGRLMYQAFRSLLLEIPYPFERVKE